MSRIYEDGDEEFMNQSLFYMRAEENALRGKNGQKFLRELEAALVAMPNKRLIRGGFCKDHEVCVLGAVALYRELQSGKDVETVLGELEEESYGTNDSWQGVKFARDKLGIKGALASAIIAENDLGTSHLQTPEERYEWMLKWVREHIIREEH